MSYVEDLYYSELKNGNGSFTIQKVMGLLRNQ